MFYTRKGDSGATKLYAYDGRIAKDDPHVEALGSVDELNSFIGYCRAVAEEQQEHDVRTYLLEIQHDLFVVQALLAGAPKQLESVRILALEAIVDLVVREIPPIHSFTVPGTTILSSVLDVARTIARRVERRVVALKRDEYADIIPYLNRLSSVLFAFARLTAHRAGKRESVPHY